MDGGRHPSTNQIFLWLAKTYFSRGNPYFKGKMQGSQIKMGKVQMLGVVVTNASGMFLQKKKERNMSNVTQIPYLMRL